MPVNPPEGGPPPIDASTADVSVPGSVPETEGSGSSENVPLNGTGRKKKVLQFQAEDKYLEPTAQADRASFDSDRKSKRMSIASQRPDRRTHSKGGNVSRMSLWGVVDPQILEEELAEQERALCVNMIIRFFERKEVDRMMMVVVLTYAFVAFVGLTFQEDISRRPALVQMMSWVDLVILSIFLTEMVLKTIGYGITFLYDLWNLFDFLIIVISLAAAVFTIFFSSWSEEMAESVKMSPLRVILRLLRLIVVFRRLSDHVDISKESYTLPNSGKEPKSRTPADLLTETLEGICKNPQLPRSVRKEIAHAVRVIRSGTLYEVSFADTGETPTGVAEEREWAKTGFEGTQSQGGGPDTPKKKHDGAAAAEYMKLQFGPVPDLSKKWMGSASKVADFLQGFVSGLNEWTFNMLTFNKQVQGKALPVVFTYVCQSNDFIEKFTASVFTLENYLNKITASYPTTNPFHNSSHAADVVATCFWTLHIGQANRILNLTPLECFAVLFSAMIHDVDHGGRTNPFLIKTRNSLALRYNDRSVLENHHCSFAYQAMHDETCNILAAMPVPDRAAMRAMVVSMVLATDVAKHFHEYGLLKARLQDKAFPDREKPADKELVLNCLVHACDIGNPSKNIDVTVEWTALVMTEFFDQGDKEKQNGFPISMFMDRTTTNIATCQVGFIDALVLPFYKGLEAILPGLQTAVQNLESNRTFWADHVDLFAERLKEGDPFPPGRLMSLLDAAGLSEASLGDATLEIGEDLHSPKSPGRLSRLSGMASSRKSDKGAKAD
jgi:hypothetical protein